MWFVISSLTPLGGGHGHFKQIGHSKITPKATLLYKPVQNEHSEYRLCLGIAKLRVNNQASSLWSTKLLMSARRNALSMLHRDVCHRWLLNASLSHVNLRRKGFLEVSALTT